MGGGTKIVITQQSANSTKSVKIQPKPEPGTNSALPVVSVPKINKGEFNGGQSSVFIYQKCEVCRFLGIVWQKMSRSKINAFAN